MVSASPMTVSSSAHTSRDDLTDSVASAASNEENNRPVRARRNGANDAGAKSLALRDILPTAHAAAEASTDLEGDEEEAAAAPRTVRSKRGNKAALDR